ncbi:putative ABC transporter permease [Actinacidiphila reveromycinica]|uniref:Putative ABC transporter permease n=1 Tax=Actinacidiphila reveromycinica TaxID=659352 RepID=A0A7U3VMS5_9ACTN|nr:ABC transporter permease [Streptomyces sp. SN-593]BBA96897.1 putative ABC transporter permease [Streptomyces sp. SN-593]
MRAVLRWALADLRTHLGQAVTIVLAGAGVTMALLISVAFLVVAAHPWQRLFTATHGAHVWMRVHPGADTSALRRLDTVTDIAGPYRTISVSVQHGANKATVGLRASTSKPPTVGRPEIVAGRWPAADFGTAAPTGASAGSGVPVVLERSVAAALWAEPGDDITARVDGTTVRLTVAALADTAEPHYSPGSYPGIGWAPKAFVDATASRTGGGTQTVGLVTSAPGDTRYLVQQAVAAVGPDTVISVSTWRDARADAEDDSHLLGVFTGLFGLGALLAAAVAATGGIGVRVRAHARDVSILKAIGMAPRQVAGTFLLQHLVLVGGGVLTGVTAIETLGTRMPGSIGQAMTVWRELPSQGWSVSLICAATLLVICSGAAMAGWRAARLPAIPMARRAVPPSGRLSWGARTLLRWRVPPPLVLGWRATAIRPGRTAMAVLRITIPLLLISTVLGTWATLDAVQHHPSHYGLTGQLSARASTDPGAVQKLLIGAPGVVQARPEIELAALAPGQTGTVALRGIGTAAHPYPFAVVQGRAPAGLDEAVAGQGLFTALDVSVGQWIRLTVGSTPYILHLVGRNIETANSGLVVSTGFDILQDQAPSLRPASYNLQLRPGVNPDAERVALAAASRGAVEIDRVNDPLTAEFSPMRRVIVGLILLLGLVVLTELSTTTASVVRDHAVDLRAYRAAGLTPRQIVAAMSISTTLPALAAAFAGAALGVLASHRLVDLEGASSGIGAGIAHSASPVVLLLLVGATSLVAALACVPASIRAVRHAATRPAEL